VPEASPGRSDDLAELRRHAAALADAVEAALPAWVLRCVTSRCVQAGVVVDDTVVGSAVVAGRACAAEYGPALRRVLCADPDDSPGSPLALLRGAVSYPGRVLESLGVPPVPRDEFAERAFPGDRWDLGPATWSDVEPTLGELGIVWGAARAHVHLSRRAADRR
jgi:hypothetical protein